MGLYLGPSPRHPSSVSRVLNLETDMIYPQFHVQHDDLFEIVQPTSVNDTKLSQWHQSTEFVKNRRNSLLTQHPGSDPNPVIPEQEHKEIPPQ